jgi:hypothetical protein
MTAKYIIAPPTLAPLLMEFGDYESIPEQAWDEYCAAQAYWARSRRYYFPPAGKRKQPVARLDTPTKPDKQGPKASSSKTKV